MDGRKLTTHQGSAGQRTTLAGHGVTVWWSSADHKQDIQEQDNLSHIECTREGDAMISPHSWYAAEITGRELLFFRWHNQTGNPSPKHPALEKIGFGTAIFTKVGHRTCEMCYEDENVWLTQEMMAN